MHKLRTAATVLLAAVLIGALAVLPRAVGEIRDEFAGKTPISAPMQSVALAFGADRVSEPGYMLRKLALEQNMFTVPIQPSQATMSEDDALEAAMFGMRPYIDSELYHWFDGNFVNIQPYIGIDPENKSNNMIFWAITYAHDREPYQYLFLHIDDETGCVLYIDYETSGDDRLDTFDSQNQPLLMEKLIDAFLRPLNLLEEQMPDAQNQLSREITEVQRLESDVTCIAYTLEDALYGAVRLQFYITPEGFRVYLPGD